MPAPPHLRRKLRDRRSRGNGALRRQPPRADAATLTLATPVQPDPRVAAHRAHAILGLILVLALGVRMWGLGWGLPWAFHPDEIFYVDQAEDILKFGDPNPKYFKNPSGLTYLLALELLVLRALAPLAGPLGAGLPGGAYLVARLDSALLGTASVALVYLVGARLFDRRVGLLAALFLALSFLHVRDSHYGVNDIPATALLLVSLYACARILDRPQLRWYLLAGLAGGLATSTKYNMGFFFVPIVAAHVLAHLDGGTEGRRDGGTEGLGLALRRILAVLLALRPSVPPSLCLSVAAAAAAAGYLLATPYTLLDFRRFSEDFLTQFRFGNTRWLGQPLEPVPLLYLTSLLQGFGAMLLVLALVGLVLALRRRRRQTILLLAFPAVYLGFLMPKELFFPRFTMPLIPPLAILAAYGAAEAAGLLMKARPTQMQDLRRRVTALLALLLAVLMQPIFNIVQHNQMLLRGDTRVLANEWVQANLPPGSRLRVEDYSLLDFSSRQPRAYLSNPADLRIERLGSPPDAEQARVLAERNVQYVVTSSFAADRYLLDPPTRRDREDGERYLRLHRSLENRAELIARFSPGWANAEVPYRHDDVLTPFWSLPDYERTGPTIRIYLLAAVEGGP